MNDTKHTPGPWVTEVSDRGLQPGGKTYVEHWVRAPDVRIICSRIDGEADARLIAAAPELLAALEMLVDAVTDSTAGSTRAYREHAIRDARAAIARARGDK